MKALILSDIHSNLYALQAIWARERDSDLIYCAGDLVDYGPHPGEAINWIRSRQVVCVQGNHDRFVALCYRRGQTLASISPQERAWVHHNAELLGEEEITFLEELPQAVTFELDGIAYGMTHLYQGYEEIVSLHAFEQFIAGTIPAGHAPITRLILGHTHRQAIRYLSNTILWLNPGSASYRRADDPDQTAHYITITDGSISLHRLAYDIGPLRQAVEQVALKEAEVRLAQRFFRKEEK